MRGFLLKDLKVYVLGLKNIVIVYKGKYKNEGSKQHPKPIKLMLAKNEKDLKETLQKFYRKSNKINLVNLRGERDFIKLATKNIGGKEEFKKLCLKIKFREPYHNLNKISPNLYELEERWDTNEGGIVRRHEIHKVKNNLKIKKLDIDRHYATKGLRNSMQTALNKRTITTTIEDIILEMQTKDLKIVKLQFQKERVERYRLGKTFYVQQTKEKEFVLKDRINARDCWCYTNSKIMQKEFEGVELKVFV